MAEALPLAKQPGDTHMLAGALHFAAMLGQLERNPTEVERVVSDLMELSTRHHFALWLSGGAILAGWARSARGSPTEGLAGIEGGIRDYRATGSMLRLPYYLALKAEVLHSADRTPEALEVLQEAEAVVERSEERGWSAELHRLWGVFLAAVDAEAAQVEAAFCEAIRTAQQQKSVSLLKRAEASYAEYLGRQAGR